MDSDNAFDVLPSNLMGVDMSVVPIFLTISWGVWKYKNLRLFENSDSTILDVVDNCLGYTYKKKIVLVMWIVTISSNIIN